MPIYTSLPGGTSANFKYASSLIDRLSRPSSTGIPLAATLPTADTPTIVVSTSPTLTSSYVSPQDTKRVTLTGTTASYDSVNGRANLMANPPGLDFFFEGTSFEVNLFTAISPQPYQIYVNSIPIADTPPTAGSGGFVSIKATFPGSAKRRIEFYAPGIQAFYGMGVPIGQFPVASPRNPVVGWVGDSFLAGSAACTYLQSLHHRASRTLGVEESVVAAGGTGYVNAGSSTVFGDPTRVSQLAQVNPELIIFFGSVNDSVTGLQAAATACYNAYAAALPNARFIVFGPPPSSATATTSLAIAQSNNAVYSAASVHPSVLAYVDLIGNAKTGTVPSAWVAANTWAPGSVVTNLGSLWSGNFATTLGGDTTGGLYAEWSLLSGALFGTGNVGSPAGDGSRDTLLYSDNTHPTVLGSEALGLIVQKAVRDTLQALVKSS